MKKIYLMFYALLFSAGIHAEDVLQIVPQQIVAGSSADDGRTFAIEMNNENEFVALQFDLYMPDGVILDNVYDPIELSKDRFPHTTGRGGAITWEHDVDLTLREEGFYRIAISSSKNSKISGTSGTLINVFYISDSELPDGVLPVEIKNVVMAISGTSDVKPDDCSSFFYTDKFGWNASKLDLSALTGTLTTDVVEAVNSNIADNANLTTLDLSGIDNAGVAFESANPNALVYAKSGSTFASLQQTAWGKNVVDGNVCGQLTITDGYPFNVEKGFTATAATYQRALAKDGWYSLCLPYAANKPAGVTVERFSELDVSAGTVVFAEGDVAANVPCIFNAPAGNITFSASDVEIVKTPEKMNDGAFVGVYDKTGEGAIAGSYALFADGSGFGIAGTTAYAEPFRAYIESESSNAKTLRLIHGETTGVDLLEKEVGERSDIYSIDGRYAGRSIEQLPKGIYIINNKKLIK